MSGHIHALEFFGGAPRLIVPDNTKTGVTQGLPLRSGSEPDVPGDGHALWSGVMPARPYKPRDKAKVEVSGSGSGTLDHRGAPAAAVL